MAPEFAQKVLALYHMRNMGAHRICHLINKTNNLSTLSLGPKWLSLVQQHFPKVTLGAPNWRAVKRDMKWLESPWHHLVVWGQPNYPERLRHISNPPALLFVEGQVSALSAPQLSFVGSRRPTAIGTHAVKTLVGDMVSAGFVITSGFALGIDGTAHQSALDAGGQTIAIKGCGLDVAYPRAHARLGAQIVATGGALVSEWSLGTPPAPFHFPHRNRVVSGLAIGVVVVEAALKSGSLITANIAVQQNREVFALPGPFGHLNYQGCHVLIQQGAKLVSKSSDILDEVQNICRFSNTKEVDSVVVQAKTTPKDSIRRVWQAIGPICTPADVIINRTGLSADTVHQALQWLRQQGQVERENGGYVRRSGRTP